MIHVRQLDTIQLDKPSMVTIGVFDGVHRGHQALIKHLVDEAHADDRLAVVLTFDPHPDVVLQDITDRYYLTTPEQRAQLLGDMGVDVVVTHPFDASVREIRAEDFVDKLLASLNMTCLRVGIDFALGYQREGDVDYLRELGIQKGYELRPIDLIKLSADEDNISSSRIRQLLRSGDILKANDLLGRPYTVTAKVIEGDQRGRTIGFPTANMDVWDQQVLPAQGVYAGWATLGDEQFMAVANLGVRPTFDGHSLSLEPYLLDFDRNIYGQALTLTFEHRLRSEQKFDGLEALKAQLQQDIVNGRTLLSS
ncbi:MAG: bifunctional riboflavin kinase/FAD synthetase [Phototrophicaceae bacterium]